jgi:hypothetical protein
MDAPPPSGELRTSQTAHQQRMMGATAALGGEEGGSRDAGVAMEDVGLDSFSAQL